MSDEADQDELTNEPESDDDAVVLDEDGADRRRFVIRNHIKKRLDSYLQGRLKGISRSRVQKLIDLGGVKVNDTTPKSSTKIKTGDVIDVVLPPPAIRTIEPEDIPLNILYEDDSFLIVNKQANLIVHPARSNLSGTLLNGLAHHFKMQSQQRGGNFDGWQTRGFRQNKKRTVDGLSQVGADECRPGIVHRLDKNTTGVMVVAKSDDAHWSIAKQFEQRVPIKAYLALVHGAPDPSDGPGCVIEAPIGKHPTIREAFGVRHDSKSKQSVTLYRVRERYRGYTLLELELKTGRTHQIRVHLQYIGLPIVGDITYGGEPLGEGDIDNPPIAAGSKKFVTYARTREEGLAIEAKNRDRDDLLLAHPALHAGYLNFIHPVSDERVTFTAPVHERMRSIIHQMRQHRVDGPTAKQGVWIDLDQCVSDASN